MSVIERFFRKWFKIDASIFFAGLDASEKITEAKATSAPAVGPSPKGNSQSSKVDSQGPKVDSQGPKVKWEWSSDSGWEEFGEAENAALIKGFVGGQLEVLLQVRKLEV